MKERIETITKSFIDYKGEEHKFVVAAVSEVLPTNYTEYANDDSKDDRKVSYEVSSYIEDYGTDKYYENVVKKVKLGVSICNPEDSFNEEIGKKKAIHRAKNGNTALWATKCGYINGKVVKALLESEAEFIKNNPGLYIKGYDDMVKAYSKRKSMENFVNNLTEEEAHVINKLKEDPEFIEDAIKYLKWKNGQK